MNKRALILSFITGWLLFLSCTHSDDSSPAPEAIITATINGHPFVLRGHEITGGDENNSSNPYQVPTDVPLQFSGQRSDTILTLIIPSNLSGSICTAPPLHWWCYTCVPKGGPIIFGDAFGYRYPYKLMTITNTCVTVSSFQNNSVSGTFYGVLFRPETDYDSTIITGAFSNLPIHF